jgi:hypothetical protein
VEGSQAESWWVMVEKRNIVPTTVMRFMPLELGIGQSNGGKDRPGQQKQLEEGFAQ